MQGFARAAMLLSSLVLQVVSHWQGTPGMPGNMSQAQASLKLPPCF